MRTALHCVLIGHNYTHEIQVIAQIFYPNTRFTFGEDITKLQNGITVVGMVEGVYCTGQLYRDGQQVSTSSLSTKDTGTTIKRTLMLALFYALKEATGLPTPWGALTGVRPAKQVRMWLAEGDTEDKIVKRLSDIYKLRDDKIKLAMTVARAEENLITKHAPGVGLYIGIPFCPSRCLYCSFVTSQTAENIEDAHSKYLDALAEECSNIPTDNINTVYIGGGTPTALCEKNLVRLLEIAAPFTNNIEYTVEAGRPDSITEEKLSILKSYGVNRIAINPQTLNDNTLKRIGRLHTAQDFYNAYQAAVKAGFTNINTDVIAGLPGETQADMLNTMQELKKLSPAHITVHTLAVKRSSRLNENLSEYPVSEHNTVDQMLDIAREICENLGLAPYYMYRQKNMVGHFENVGYAKSGYENLYNVAMMAETQTVIGAGAGAVTKVVEGDLITRKFNAKDVETYVDRRKTHDTSTKRS